MRSHTGATTEWSFSGEQNDPTGLEFLRARYYEPALGRFLSRDPFTGLSVSPLSQNRYAYVWNNPLNLVDAYGYAPWDVVGDVADKVGECLGDPADCAGDAVEGVGKGAQTVGTGLKKGGEAVWSAGEWALENLIIPGDCFKMVAGTVLLGANTAVFATLPLGLSATGVGGAAAVAIAVESETAMVASGVATYYVGKAAWDICRGHVKSDEAYQSQRCRGE